MHLRHVACILTVLSLSALSACRGKSTPISEQAEDVLTQAESEPINNELSGCDALVSPAALVGSVSPGDSDHVCVRGYDELYLTAPSTVSVTMVTANGRRVDLGNGTGGPKTLRFPPSAEWVVELRGEGEWRMGGQAAGAAPYEHCGFRLGSTDAPLVLSFDADMPEFPLCADAATGTARLHFPALRPDGLAGFDIRVNGLDEQTRGALRIYDEGELIAQTALTPGQSLPSLRWLPGSLLQAELTVVHSAGPKTLSLTVDKIAMPPTPREVLELEPNDAETNAVPITGVSVVAGSLFHLQDIDRFRIAEFSEPLGVEILAQTETRVRLLSSSALGTQEGVRGEDGVYRICALDAAPLTPVDVRVAYAEGAAATDGVYQLSFVPAASATDEPARVGPLVIPMGQPTGDFGFAVQRAEGQPNLRGRIFPPDNVDEWLFQVPESASDFHVKIVARAQSAMDLKLRVLDADRIVVATADRGAAGQEESLELELPTGYYILEIRAVGVSGCEGTYELGISSPDARPSAGSDWDAVHGDQPPQYIQRLPDLEQQANPARPTPSVPRDEERKPKPPETDEPAPEYPW